MEHPYEWYKEQSTDNLILLKEDASNELFKLQSKPSQRKVNYWTTIYAMVSGILKERNNG